MSKHLNMHRGIKPERLQCHICENTLSSANALKVHVETIHEGSKFNLSIEGSQIKYKLMFEILPSLYLT